MRDKAASAFSSRAKTAISNSWDEHVEETEGHALNMAKRCYYETLGLVREADEPEIKSAYRRLAKECHPDRNPGDTRAEVRFKEVSEAYEVLKDPQKRAPFSFCHVFVPRFGDSDFCLAGKGRRGLISHNACWVLSQRIGTITVWASFLIDKKGKPGGIAGLAIAKCCWIA